MMKRQRLGCALILLVAFALRVHALGAKSLWYDELRQVEVASHPLVTFPSGLAQHSARPLDYWLTHYLLRAGHQEFWLRFPAALWGTLGVALMLPLARRWLDRWTAVLATALMAAAPIGVQYSQELRPYALYLLFTLISFWGLERGINPHPDPPPFGRASNRGGSRTPLPLSGNFPTGEGAAGWGLIFGLASIGGALTHFFYAFLLTAQVLFVAGLFALRKLRWPQFVAFGAGGLAGYAALFVAANPLTLTTFAGSFLSALVKAPVSGFPIELDPRIKVIFVHLGLTPAEMEAEAAQFAIPPPSVH